MKIALAVHRVTGAPEENLTTIKLMCHTAADNGAGLVVFAEAALTGLIITDDPIHDIPLGQPVPGPVTENLATICKKRGIWIATGLLEYADTVLYDSAVLIDPTGIIRMKYRRITDGWHSRNATPSVYGHGQKIETTLTPFGTAAFLICGDLFDDTIVSAMKSVNPELLLFPFARCFTDGTDTRTLWEKSEKYLYTERVRQIGVTTLMVNYLSDTSLAPEVKVFGGAMIVSSEGGILDSLPLESTGILYTEL